MRERVREIQNERTKEREIESMFEGIRWDLLGCLHLFFKHSGSSAPEPLKLISRKVVTEETKKVLL